MPRFIIPMSGEYCFSAGFRTFRLIVRFIRNDIVWIMEGGSITEKRSMHCPGLDDERVDEGDPDLVIESATSPNWFWSLVNALRSVIVA